METHTHKRYFRDKEIVSTQQEPIRSRGTKECKISSGKCVHAFQKVFENTRKDAVALADSTLVSALQTLEQTTICYQSNTYFTLSIRVPTNQGL